MLVPTIRAKKHVEQLAVYVAPLEGRRDKLRLDFNENTVGPSPRVLAAIRALPPSAYATYPEYAGLEAAFARYVEVDPAFVAAFNGVDAAIRAVFDAYGDEGAELITTCPTFGYYAPCASQHGMVIKAIPYAEDLSFPLETMLRSLAKGPRLLFLCNPNNPTGTLLEPEAVLELARCVPETLVIVDELYADFTGCTVLPQALSLPNVVVLRSLSKSSGLAALRIGFAVGHTEVLDRLTRVTGPYDINMFAVVAARAALDDKQYVTDYVAQVEQAKQWSIARLRQLGVRFHAAGGNFVLVWPPGDVPSAVRQLDAQGILVRSMSGKPLIDGSFRLTIGTRAQMEEFFAVFERMVRASSACAAQP
jgi:histidinol-phosphate aminotransferase